MTDQPVARRTVNKNAGVGAGLASDPSLAHAKVAETPTASSVDIWSHEYWAKKGDVKLNLWRKRVGAPKPGEAPLPVLFLVHGSSNSTRSTSRPF